MCFFYQKKALKYKYYDYVLKVDVIESSDNEIKERSFCIDGINYEWKFIYFPQGNADLISCCELAEISWGRVEMCNWADSVTEAEFEMTSTYYVNIVNGIKKKRKKMKRSNARQLQFDDRILLFYEVDLKFCNCQYVADDKRAVFPQGYESYVSEIQKVRKMSKRMFSTFRKDGIPIFRKIDDFWIKYRSWDRLKK